MGFHVCEFLPSDVAHIKYSYWYPDFEAFQQYSDATYNFHMQNTTLSDGEMKVESCQSDNWHAERVGPMVSHGGNDWWFVLWSSDIALRGPDPVALDAYELALIDRQGFLIPHPPLHLHHTHWMPNFEVPLCHEGTKDLNHELCKLSCTFEGRNCAGFPEASAVIAAHGDWQEAHHPMRHFQQDLTGQEMVVAGGLHLVYMMNDRRPAGSAPLKFYAYAGMRFVPSQHVDRPASRLIAKNVFTTPFMAHDGVNMLASFSKQSNSWSYFSFQMPFSGELINSSTVLHTHMDSFLKAVLLRGVVHEFGFPLIRPTGDVLYEEYPVVRELLDNLTTDSRCVCFVKGERLIVNGTVYDRAGITSCATIYFEIGDQFTSLALHGDVGAGTGRALLHTNWQIIYWAGDKLSHYTQVAGSFDSEPIMAMRVPEFAKFALFLRVHASAWLIVILSTLGVLIGSLHPMAPPRTTGVIAGLFLGVGVSCATVTVWYWYKFPLITYIMRDIPSAHILSVRNWPLRAWHFTFRLSILLTSVLVSVVAVRVLVAPRHKVWQL